MTKLHKHLSKEDKEKHFRHELGLRDSYARNGVSNKYRDGWERIFGKKNNKNQIDSE